MPDLRSALDDADREAQRLASQADRRLTPGPDDVAGTGEHRTPISAIRERIRLALEALTAEWTGEFGLAGDAADADALASAYVRLGGDLELPDPRRDRDLENAQRALTTARIERKQLLDAVEDVRRALIDLGPAADALLEGRLAPVGRALKALYNTVDGNAGENTA